LRRLLALLLVALPLCAAERDLPAPVRDALARAGVPASAVGAVVVPVDRGEALVSLNADEPMNPASAMKLVTAYAALDLLGAAFTFHTDFLATGELASGVLEGDLVIRGGGDPKLTADRLWLALHELRSRGVREIAGDIVIDRSYFAVAAHDPGRFDNDPRRAYNVGPDAFLVNFHAVEFRFVPDGNTVRVFAQPDMPNLEITSRVRAVPGPCGWWRENLKHDFIENGLIATVGFSGAYPAACGENSWALAPFDSAGFAESVLRWTWSEAGGKLRGKVRAGPVPAGARLLFRVESEPLANIVRDMNKFSNNVIARHLFLALSAERQGPGDTRASAQAVREWLQSRGLDAPGFTIENGAGLSRDDRITAGTLAALLRNAWASALMPELAASMPIFATDGTLKSRRAAGAAGQAHLKGGTLTGVQSMAGYVLDRSGRRWAVVMMVNHPRANATQPALDALVEWVHAQGAERRMAR
jgi:D-alanyl-D-alanine carboxypeptidase/D-alanyl-D-alanine-endopeptidase (penicillin-binding protein 4)